MTWTTSTDARESCAEAGERATAWPIIGGSQSLALPRAFAQHATDLDRSARTILFVGMAQFVLVGGFIGVTTPLTSTTSFLPAAIAICASLLLAALAIASAISRPNNCPEQRLAVANSLEANAAGWAHSSIEKISHDKKVSDHVIISISGQDIETATDPHSQPVWSDLIHQVHHELRTPLNALLGFSDLMKQEAFGPLGSPRYSEYLDHIQESGHRLLQSSQDTLAIAEHLATAQLATDNAQATGPNAEGTFGRSKSKQTPQLATRDEVPTTCALSVVRQFQADYQKNTQKLAALKSKQKTESLRLLGDAQSITRCVTCLLQEATRQTDVDSETILHIVHSDTAYSFRIEIKNPKAQIPAASGSSLNRSLLSTLADLIGAHISIDTPSAPDTWNGEITIPLAPQVEMFPELL